MYLHAVNFSLSLTSRTVPWRAARTGGGGARLGAAARERGRGAPGSTELAQIAMFLSLKSFLFSFLKSLLG